jgi:hypothetical protein
VSQVKPDPDTAARMRATAAALAAGGLEAKTHAIRGVLDITASLRRPDGKPVKVIIDEDGYAEIRYWNAPGATPAQVAAVVTAALATIAAATVSEPAQVAGGIPSGPA